MFPSSTMQARAVGLAIAAVVTIVTVVAAAAPSVVSRAVPGTASTASAPHALAGTWSLEAADDILPDGSRIRAYGSAPRGLLVVDAEGRYSLQLFRSDRLRFASGEKRRGTVDEYQSAVMGMSSHVGHIEADSTAGVLTFHIALASFPNWEGTRQRRSYELVGDLLSYRLPAQAGSSSNIPFTAWRRVRADHRP